jgi:hypothetical protein
MIRLIGVWLRKARSLGYESGLRYEIYRLFNME